ncbi:hypothetical protein DRJ17_01390 [Candidatus Woesearchaeota archaeon]|nr:MAG: hypothetical protein DRJ17_01390 [Candidatus Woesearchaeota archaeon]
MPEEVYSYEVVHEAEDNTLRINAENIPKVPSIEDDPITMAKTVEMLAATKGITKIVFYQKRDYEYDYYQTQILTEIAKIYNSLLKQRDALKYDMTSGIYGRYYDARYTELQYIIYTTLKSDPIAAYVRLRRLLRREGIELQRNIDPRMEPVIKKFISVVKYILDILEKTRLITLAKPYLTGYTLGDRNIYRRIFAPIIRPDFMYTKLQAQYPVDATEIDNFTIGRGTEVSVFRLHDSVQTLYHITPPEFKLTEDEYEILDLARNILSEHKPTREEFVDPLRMREVFLNVGRDLIEELATYHNVKLGPEKIEMLAEILIRYTVGFGLIEVILQDSDVQDISINSPAGNVPIFIVHGKYDDCVTNILPTRTETDSWAGKLRMISGRPLDEANPILDTELTLPSARTRVAVITSPLDPTGLAFSFRRHRDKPWTLPLFIHYKMIDHLAAGLISFLIDGTRTILIAGTRSSGKTSFIGSMLTEIMRRYRIITIEDTLELPTDSLRKLGYNIQSLKVASALERETTEVSASDGIRSTLRLGDSALIVGEVRSREAISLYEAMRVGAAANVVAGTIHAANPYGVYDRVVNDIGVPNTSFKATDIIIVANPIKSPDGLHKWRRITQITEVRKHWTKDPLVEKGFVDLMRYDAKKDRLVPTDEFINGDSDVLKAIAGNIKEFAGNWDAVWDNIELRAKIKKRLVEVAEKNNDLDMLEADFVILANDMYHLYAEEVKERTGKLKSQQIFLKWDNWLKKAVRQRKMKKEGERE